jgi:ABC-type taurine transport system ATPase subunit
MRRGAAIPAALTSCQHARGAGCGKTTLLGILAGSVASLSASSRVSGRITLDGHERRSWASRLVAYVPQNDFLLPTLTVAETLCYSAQLRLPRGTSAAEVQARPLAGPRLPLRPGTGRRRRRVCSRR